MAKSKNKKLKGLSSFFNNAEKEKVTSEVILRESFLRAVRETTDNFGLDNFSIERIHGMLEVIEQFVIVREETES